MTARAVRSTAARMFAWRVHTYGAGELALDAARVPALRAPDELLVRVLASGLNPLDAAMTRGYGARALNALRAIDDEPELPLVCGREFLGEVERAGPEARLRRGQRVWGVVPPHRTGAHAQRVLVRDAWAGPAPTTLSDLQCGGAPYAALTACAALRAAGPAKRALVLGLGGVGQAAVQLLAARGTQVTVSCSADQLETAAELGAACAIDRRAPDAAARLEVGAPYCVILDCAGLGGDAPEARRWSGARYVTLTSPLLSVTDERGLWAGFATAGLRLVSQACAARSAGTGGVRWAYFSPRSEDLETLRRLAEAGRYRVLVTQVFPWWKAAEAYERTAAGGARGKLLLDWSLPAPEHLH